MIRSLLLSFVLAACAPHDVEVLLGPDDKTLTIGFRCFRGADDPSNPNPPYMFASAVDGPLVKFAMVVDVITIDQKFPGCRGEELIQACRGTGACDVFTANGRYCQDIEVPLNSIDISDPAAVLRTLGDELREQGPIIARDTPDVPVVVRAVATTQTCAEVMAAPNFPLLDAAEAIGCAYSCPTLLDEVDGPISLSLDALTSYCEPQVRACAAFPANP